MWNFNESPDSALFLVEIPDAVRQRDGSFVAELMMVRKVKSGDRI